MDVLEPMNQSMLSSEHHQVGYVEHLCGLLQEANATCVSARIEICTSDILYNNGNRVRARPAPQVYDPFFAGSGTY
jgi:hypothetical protein